MQVTKSRFAKSNTALQKRVATLAELPQLGWHRIQFHLSGPRGRLFLASQSQVSITHSAKFVEGGNVVSSVDQFAVTYTMVTALHPNGNVLSSVTRTVGNFDEWLDAYYCAIEYIRHISK